MTNSCEAIREAIFSLMVTISGGGTSLSKAKTWACSHGSRTRGSAVERMVKVDALPGLSVWGADWVSSARVSLARSPCFTFPATPRRQGAAVVSVYPAEQRLLEELLRRLVVPSAKGKASRWGPARSTHRRKKSSFSVATKLDGPRARGRKGYRKVLMVAVPANTRGTGQIKIKKF
jgi:hypothetical protein